MMEPPGHGLALSIVELLNALMPQGFNAFDLQLRHSRV
jgi:hypothetical protein